MGELNIHEIDKYKRGFRDVRKLKMSRQKQREQERIENFKKKKVSIPIKPSKKQKCGRSNT